MKYVYIVLQEIFYFRKIKTWLESSHLQVFIDINIQSRLEICHWWSCKIFSSCVNFFQKTTHFSAKFAQKYEIHSIIGTFILTFCLKLLKFYIFYVNFNKKGTYLRALLVCKIFGLKIGSFKMFDKFQVWSSQMCL